VDTLQIRANAVTVPASATRTSAFTVTTGWTTVGATSYTHGIGGTIPGIAQITIEASADYEEFGTLEFQLIINDSIAAGTYDQSLAGHNTVSCTRFFEVNLPSGSYTIYMRCRKAESSQTVHFEGSGFVILGAKR